MVDAIRAVMQEAELIVIMAIKAKHRGVEQLVARWAHNPKVIRSSRISATKDKKNRRNAVLLFYDNSSFTDFIHNLISVINKDINKVINRLIGL